MLDSFSPIERAAALMSGFDNALGLLGEERRGWLAHALRVCLPGHEWLARL